MRSESPGVLMLAACLFAITTSGEHGVIPAKRAPVGWKGWQVEEVRVCRARQVGKGMGKCHWRLCAALHRTVRSQSSNGNLAGDRNTEAAAVGKRVDSLRGGGWVKESKGWVWISPPKESDAKSQDDAGPQKPVVKKLSRYERRKMAKKRRREAAGNTTEDTSNDGGKGEKQQEVLTDTSTTTAGTQMSTSSTTLAQGVRRVDSDVAGAASLQQGATPAWIPPEDLDLPVPLPPPRPPPQRPHAQEPVSDLDMSIVAMLRNLSETSGISEAVMEKLRAAGVTERDFSAAGLQQGGAGVQPGGRKSFIMTAEDGVTVLPKDDLGRFPPWTGDKHGILSILDRNPMSMVRVGGKKEEEAMQLALRSSVFGHENVSCAVMVPPKILNMARNRTRCIMTAAGNIWRDKNLEQWPGNDFRIFVGDLSPHCTDRDLTEALRSWPGFNMARVVKDHHTGKCRGYGFASFASAKTGTAVIKHQRKEGDTIDVRGRPVVLKRSTWAKKLFTPDKMPRVKMLREAKENLVGMGLMDPEEVRIRNKEMRASIREAGIHKIEYIGK